MLQLVGVLVSTYHGVKADVVYRCETCSQTFANRSNLKIHEKHVHSNERLFVCESCNKTFKRKKDVVRHQRQVRTGRISNSHINVILMIKSIKCVIVQFLWESHFFMWSFCRGCLGAWTQSATHLSWLREITQLQNCPVVAREDTHRHKTLWVYWLQGQIYPELCPQDAPQVRRWLNKASG